MTYMTILTFLLFSFRPQKYGLGAKIPAENQNKKQADLYCYLPVQIPCNSILLDISA